MGEAARGAATRPDPGTCCLPLPVWGRERPDLAAPTEPRLHVHIATGRLGPGSQQVAAGFESAGVPADLSRATPASGVDSAGPRAPVPEMCSE